MIDSVVALLERGDLLVTVGSGGVGKTTVSAALGLRAALLGKRVLVITIDPARRLATSLGLEETGNRIVEVPGVVPEDVEGSLWALMLDARSTFDELIVRISPDAASKKRVLNNRIYRLLSESISGSHNAMATSKLYEVMSSKEFDLVVLDTPPTSNALDFLDSSGYLARFFDDRVMSWFMADKEKKGLGARILAPTRNLATRLLAALFGREFLVELLDFFDAIGGIYRQFNTRVEEVRQMLRRNETSFVVVCTPRSLSLRETMRLAEQLDESGHPVRTWFANQCGPFPGRKPGKDGHLLGSDSAELLLQKLENLGFGESSTDVLEAIEASYARSVAESETDARLLKELGPDDKKVLVRRLPRLDEEVVELAALTRFAQLFDYDLAAADEPG